MGNTNKKTAKIIEDLTRIFGTTKIHLYVHRNVDKVIVGVADYWILDLENYCIYNTDSKVKHGYNFDKVYRSDTEFDYFFCLDWNDPGIAFGYHLMETNSIMGFKYYLTGRFGTGVKLTFYVLDPNRFNQNGTPKTQKDITQKDVPIITQTDVSFITQKDMSFITQKDMPIINTYEVDTYFDKKPICSESSSTKKSPPIEWNKIPETALIDIIKRLSRNDFNRFRRYSKKFNDRIKQLETEDFYKELIAKLPYAYVPIVLKAPSGVYSVAWSPDGKRLASDGADRIIPIWEFETETETFQQEPSELKGHTNQVKSVAWSPDGTRLASGGWDTIIRIWKFDPKTETFQQNPSELKGHTNSVMSVAWSPDGTQLASGGFDGILRIWTFDSNTETFQQEPSELKGLTTPSVAWSPDGTRLASGGNDKIIRISKFDPKTKTFQQNSSLKGHTNSVRSVAWSPDGTRLASGGHDKIIRIWKFDPNTKIFQQGPLELRGHTDIVMSVAWSPDGTRLASGGWDKIIRIWKFDPKTETFQQNPLELKGHTAWVSSVAWSPDNTRLASVGEKILIWMS